MKADKTPEEKPVEIDPATAHILPRAGAYPRMQDALDALAKSIATGDSTDLNAWALACMDVKKRFPKNNHVQLY
jgi:hypothetical protein